MSKHLVLTFGAVILGACLSVTPFSASVESLVGRSRMTPSAAYAADIMTFTPQSHVMDAVRHPAFSGFGSVLFPAEFRQISPDMTLSGIDPLLPWHSHINAAMTAEVLNAMLMARQNGKPVFYDLSRQQPPTGVPLMPERGLFFFRGKPGAPFAIVCPGGGFAYVGSIHESLPLALKLSQLGINTFALHYRTGGARPACEDLAAALSFVFRHADELDIDTRGYSLWGGSAGARMAAFLGSYGPEAFGGETLPRPAAVIMQYTGHDDVALQEVPTFAIVGEKDGIAQPRVMEQRIRALERMGVPVSFRIYPGLEHGFGLGIGTLANGWHEEALAFWLKHRK